MSTTNRLIKEKSPYLKQHAKNPVEWYPWSSEAFEKARKENKPIFLSIGYSTCHWCHVMAHESFEDPKVASILNKNFISVKVDREERPDIDKIYMNTCQMITGSGGWPLTIIMTPGKKPFFAGTYIPKHSRFGIKGLMTILPEIMELWKSKNDELKKSAQKITKMLQKTTISKSGNELEKTALDSAYEQLFNSFDELYGGFGYQPKFPTPHNLIFLLRYWKRTGKNFSLKMVETTLKQMRMGGIYDHIGFGFHRYSTDRKWILPHFEKMLYDQALLILAYAETYQATNNQLYKKTAKEIIKYVLCDMTSEDGGFYSGEDADSEGEEGKFYTWSYDELKQILDSEEIDLISKFYNIKEKGNFNSEAGKKRNENILYQSTSNKEFAKLHKFKEKQLSEKLENIRKNLFNIRKKRIHPGKDDKILTDWNGLMIAALAKAACVFNDKIYIKKLEKNLSFILKKMLEPSGELLHRYKNGDAEITGFADDYAFLVWGLIETYQTTFNPKYLQIAIDLNQYLMDHFWDEKNGGVFFTSDLNEELLIRTKEVYDGAIPSSNSITIYNLLRLARITGKPDFEKKAKKIEKSFSNQITTIPSSYTQMMTNLDFAIGPSHEIVILGKKDERNTQKIIRELNLIYQPNKVMILKEPNSKDSLIEKLAPYIKHYSQMNCKATVYICRNQQCQLPTTDIDKMRNILIK